MPVPEAGCLDYRNAAHVGVLSTDEQPLMRPPHSLVTCFVAMHALPQGCELVHSYVPLDSPYDERKEHMLSDYGNNLKQPVVDSESCVVIRIRVYVRPLSIRAEPRV